VGEDPGFASNLGRFSYRLGKGVRGMKNLQEQMLGIIVTITWKDVTVKLIISTGAVIALIVLWKLIS
jgi:hypothetical protein